MTTFYHDGNETPTRENSHDAPEAVNRLSPVVTRSSIDGELRRQYSMRSVQWLGSPLDLDTEKEVVTCFPMESGEAPRPQASNSPDWQVVSPIGTTENLTSTTPWRPETQPVYMPASIENAGGGGGGGGSGSSSNGNGNEDNNGMPRSENPASGDKTSKDKTSPQDEQPAPEKRTIMGVRRKIFWMIFTILALIIVAIAVAAGVGASLASKKKAKVPSTSAPGIYTPSDPHDIHFLNNETWTREGLLAFQAFARPNFGGVSSAIYTGDGTRDFGVDVQFDAHSFAWVPNSHRCCVNLCSNGTRAGRMGFVCGQRKQKVTMRAVARVFVWCNEVRNGLVSDEKGCGGVL
ncbi:hypothetical protein E4U09_000319 [Claviceps aff. purpurea]|uniref:Uncharacterized protein n=1 Tax=Claviceps aff. purpurea TaxID=1967640 RepID=A0A9P7QJ69_9HYPO|nr:hypothetical protein E4U09_000319 [Claviceps aff. purpurea]